VSASVDQVVGELVDAGIDAVRAALPEAGSWIVDMAREPVRDALVGWAGKLVSRLVEREVIVIGRPGVPVTVRVSE
jgi:hypothetical protein